MIENRNLVRWLPYAEIVALEANQNWHRFLATKGQKYFAFAMQLMLFCEVTHE